MQNRVECWCGVVGTDDYTKHGTSQNCAKNGRGGVWAMMVYETSNKSKLLLFFSFEDTNSLILS